MINGFDKRTPARSAHRWLAFVLAWQACAAVAADSDSVRFHVDAISHLQNEKALFVDRDDLIFLQFTAGGEWLLHGKAGRLIEERTPLFHVRYAGQWPDGGLDIRRPGGDTWVNPAVATVLVSRLTLSGAVAWERLVHYATPVTAAGYVHVIQDDHVRVIDANNVVVADTPLGVNPWTASLLADDDRASWVIPDRTSNQGRRLVRVEANGIAWEKQLPGSDLCAPSIESAGAAVLLVVGEGPDCIRQFLVISRGGRILHTFAGGLIDSPVAVTADGTSFVYVERLLGDGSQRLVYRLLDGTIIAQGAFETTDSYVTRVFHLGRHGFALETVARLTGIRSIRSFDAQARVLGILDTWPFGSPEAVAITRDGAMLIVTQSYHLPGANRDLALLRFAPSTTTAPEVLWQEGPREVDVAMLAHTVTDRAAWAVFEADSSELGSRATLRRIPSAGLSSVREWASWFGADLVADRAIGRVVLLDHRSQRTEILSYGNDGTLEWQLERAGYTRPLTLDGATLADGTLLLRTYDADSTEWIEAIDRNGIVRFRRQGIPDLIVQRDDHRVYAGEFIPPHRFDWRELRFDGQFGGTTSYTIPGLPGATAYSRTAGPGAVLLGEYVDVYGTSSRLSSIAPEGVRWQQSPAVCARSMADGETLMTTTSATWRIDSIGVERWRRPISQPTPFGSSALFASRRNGASLIGPLADGALELIDAAGVTSWSYDGTAPGVCRPSNAVLLAEGNVSIAGFRSSSEGCMFWVRNRMFADGLE